MVSCMAWIALAAAAAQDGWPVKTEFQMPESHGGVAALAFSPDGKAVGGGIGIAKMTLNGKTSVLGGDVVLWDLSTGKIRKTLGKHLSPPRWVCFSRDGKSLGSLSPEDGEFRLWDLGSGKIAGSAKLGGAVNENAAAIAFDGRTLVTVEQKTIPTGKEGFNYVFPGTLTARDARTGKTLWSLSDSGVVVMGLSPDGKSLAVFIQKQVMQGAEPKITEQAVKLLDALSGKDQSVLPRGELDYADAIGFLPDGKTVYGYHHRNLHRWEAQEGKPVPPLALQSWKDASILSFSADGRTLGIVDFMGERAGLVDLASGKTQVELAAKFPDSVRHPAFSPDLKWLACTRHSDPQLLGVPAPK